MQSGLAKAYRAKELFACIEIADDMAPADLSDLCDATEAAIEAGGGFGWVSVPPREALERYWRGVLAVPERHLLLARQDGAICGAIQIVEPSRHNEAQAFSASVLACFVAPWARRQGIGRQLMETAENLAAGMGYRVLHLDVRETQKEAVSLYETMGYTRWGTNPHYAFVGGKFVSGHYYSKHLSK